MANEDKIDVTDVEMMDALAEEAAGTLMDAVRADNAVDPLSADSTREITDDQLIDVIKMTVKHIIAEDVSSEIKDDALTLVAVAEEFGVDENWAAEARATLEEQLGY